MELREYTKEQVLARIEALLETATEEERKAQEERSRKYGIGIKEGGNVTKPSKWSHIPDEQFGDPVNYAYPIDDEHILPAIRYFNHEDQRVRGGYNEKEWAIIGRRIADASGKHVYKNGKIVPKEEEE